MKQSHSSLFTSLLLTLTVFIISVSVAEAYPANAHGATAGVAFNTEGTGVQTDYKHSSDVGLTLLAVRFYGLGLLDGEHINALALAPSYYLVDNRYMNFKIMAGWASTWFYWKTQDEDNQYSGVIKDNTVGGGFGVAYKIGDDYRIGFNLWVNYDYRYTRYPDDVVKGKRFFLVLPYVDFSATF